MSARPVLGLDGAEKVFWQTDSGKSGTTRISMAGLGSSDPFLLLSRWASF